MSGEFVAMFSDAQIKLSLTFASSSEAKPAYYYSPLHGTEAAKAWKSFPTDGGTYTIKVYEGAKSSVGLDSEPVVTDTFTVPAYTAPTATANLSADKKTLNVELSKAIRGNYKVELLKADGTAVGAAIEKFFDGTSKAIEFTNGDTRLRWGQGPSTAPDAPTARGGRCLKGSTTWRRWSQR